MLITVAICTRDRAASLARTLDSLAAMAPPGGPFEVLVIDNASTDDTQAVAARFAARLPLRLEHAAQPGLSHARNHAVAAARGAYIAWTDDDVVVDADWLAAYARAFARWPDASVFGGPIVPVLLPPVTPWVRDNLALLAPALAARDLGAAPGALAAAALPYGANYAVRAAEQRRCPYDPALGAAPGRGRLGEETAAMAAMLAAGGIGRWVPDCRVSHLIAPERQTAASIRRYFAAAGETEAHRRGDAGAPRVFGVPRWLWRRWLAGHASYALARLVAPPPVWLPALIVLAQAQGEVRYWRRGGAG